MTFLDAWRSDLRSHLIAFAPLVKNRPDLDPIHSLIGAALLWAIRDRQPEHREALAEACGGEPHLTVLIEAMDGWKKRVPLEALEELDRERRKSDALQAALHTLLGFFVPDLLAEKALSINIEGSVNGANVVIGGQQVVLGDLIITYIKPKVERSCPRPPSRPEHFGGRDTTLKEMIAKLAAGTSTAITTTEALQGTGGIGKTTLARVLADELYAQKKVKAVLWATVTRTPNATNILSDWVVSYADSSFDVSAFKGDAAAIAHAAKNHLESVIGEKCETCEPPRVLVVLDDVWENGLEAAKLLRDACPEHTTLLLTTRSTKVTSAFHIEPQTISYLGEEEAADLLRVYLPQTEETSRKQLGKVLGGYPLALELAARRVLNERGRHPSLAAAMEACIADYKTGVAAGRAFKDLQLEEGEAKESNVTVSLSHSYDDLTEEARARFRALGILVVDAPFDQALLAALWSLPIEDVDRAADPLRYLGLIEFKEGAYTQHAVLRAYARALLMKENEQDDAFGRYADFIIQICEQFNTLPPEQWDGVLTPYYPHIRTVGDQLVQQVEAWTEEWLIRAGEFSWNTMRYLNARPAELFVGEGQARRPERLAWLEVGLRVWQMQNNKTAEAATLNNIGLVCDVLGQPRKALEHLEQALPLSREVGERSGEAMTLSNIGSAWVNLGEPRKALEFYEQALPLSRAVCDRGGEATILNNIGQVLDVLGEPRKALEFYEQALHSSGAVGDRGGEAATLNNIGSAWVNLGEPRKALEFYEQALPLSRTVGNTHTEALALNNIGQVLNMLGEPKKALEFHEQALPLIQGVGKIHEEAVTLNNIGQVLNMLGEPKKALEFYEQALPLRRAVDDRAGEAATLNNIGSAWANMGEPRQALKFYEQALSLFRILGDRSGEAATLNNIGSAWANMGEPRQALEFYERALPLFRVLGDRSGEAATLNNIGSAWVKLGKPMKALKFYEQALPLRRAVGDTRNEAVTLNNIGSAWTDLGKPRKALEFYEQALPLRRAVGDRSGEAATLNNIGSALNALEEPKRALEFYEQALPLSRAVGDRRGEAASCFNIGLIYQGFGDLDQAIVYLEHCVQLDIETEHPDLESSRQTLEQLKRQRDGRDAVDQSIQVIHQQSVETVRQFLTGQINDEIIEQILVQLPSLSLSSATALNEPFSSLAIDVIAAMTSKPFTRKGALKELKKLQKQSRYQKDKDLMHFVAALLAILDDQTPMLPADNPYADVVQQVLSAFQQYSDQEGA